MGSPPAHDETPEGFLEKHGLRRVEARPIPGAPASVAALVDVAAEHFDRAPALADRRRRLTFAELREEVDRAADVLESAGVRPLDRVAMSLPNTVDVVVGFLAVMRLGAIWVGINTNLAPPEKRYLLDDSGATLLVASRATVEMLGSTVSSLPVDVEGPGEWCAEGSAAQRDVAHIDPLGPAAIAYTSGTTGRPKGAVHSQHNMLLPAAAITRAEPGAFLQGICLPLTILNMHVLGTIQSLMCGGLCVPMDRIDAVGAADWIAEFGVERMYATSPMVYDLLTRPEIDPADIATLTHLGVGGAKIPEGLPQRYKERFGSDFGTGYGLTEAPTGVTGGSNGLTPPPVGSAGRAKEHVALTIRDADGRALADDQEGEICVGPATSGVFAGCYTTMLGYWNRPEATEKALRGGDLHTGDVGRIDADGVLWVLDRRSDLIIRGGANVYPAEVERVIESVPAIVEVAVVPRDHPRLGEEVVAIVVAAPGVDPGEFTRQQLIDACLAELAKYKVPADWYRVEQFPRNAMGKVVKPLLRQWLRDGTWPESFHPPRQIE